MLLFVAPLLRPAARREGRAAHVQPDGDDIAVAADDIRRPLGLPRRIPSERLTAALGTARTAPTIGAGRRIRGLTLSATDIEWSSGRGPHVEGPAEALLMAMAGRHGIVPELSGPGLPTLAERIDG